MSIPFTTDDPAIGTPAKSKNNPSASVSFTGDGPIVPGFDISWVALLIAGPLEVVWAIGLKYTHGFTCLTSSIITIAAMIISIAVLSWAIHTLPVGTAYVVWTGIGTVEVAITGILLLGESASPACSLSLGLTVAGITGLRLGTH